MTELERLQAENERLRASKEWLPNRPRAHERLEERLKRPLLDRLRERQTYTPAENPDGITLDIALYDHDIMEAVAEIERLRALTTWHSIATAPKDGTRVLLAVAGEKLICECVGAWSAQHEQWRDVDYGHVLWDANEFTHWLPLPPPPPPLLTQKSEIKPCFDDYCDVPGMRGRGNW